MYKIHHIKYLSLQVLTFFVVSVKLNWEDNYELSEDTLRTVSNGSETDYYIWLSLM